MMRETKPLEQVLGVLQNAEMQLACAWWYCVGGVQMYMLRIDGVLDNLVAVCSLVGNSGLYQVVEVFYGKGKDRSSQEI